MFKKTCRLGLLMIVFGIGLLVYSSPDGWSNDRKAFKDISVDQFFPMMKNKNFTLINVHIPYEGEIGETDLLIPFNAIDRFKNKLPEDKNAKIVVYCLGGPMGNIAAKTLAGMGYSNVSNLMGGMMAWKRNGGPLQYRPK